MTHASSHISSRPDDAQKIIRSPRLVPAPTEIAPLDGRRRALFVRLIIICAAHITAQIALIALRCADIITANAAFSLTGFAIIIAAAFLLLAITEKED